MKLLRRPFAAYNALLLAIGAAALFAIVAAAFVFSGRTQDQSGEALRAARIDRLVLEVIGDLVDAETAQRGFIITSNESYLAPYVVAREQFEADAAELRLRSREVAGGGLFRDEEIERLIDVGRRKMDLVRHNLDEVRAGNLDGTRVVIASDAGKKLMDEIRTLGGSLRERVARHRIDAAARMREAAASLTTMISLGAAMIVVLTIGAALLVRRHMAEIEGARRDLADINAGLEEQVRERTAGVMRANDELQRYAYIVSHDLRAPLVNVMGFTSELEASTRTIRAHFATHGLDAADPEARDVLTAVEEDIPEALGFIRSSTTRMDGLINEILKLSRAGRRLLEPETIDVEALVQECISAIRHRFDETGARVEIEGRLPTIVSDRAALQQIFTNLLDNAAKYLVAGRPGQIVVRGRIERWNAVFEVEDNGRGIAAADHERIFELFRRAGPQDRPGEGIGLAHTRAMVRRLGGDVTATSDGETGTLFRVVVAKDLALRIERGDT